MSGACIMCEGHRNVATRRVLDVDLDVCDWCYAQCGPTSHSNDTHAYYAAVAEAEQSEPTP